jgi:hypothetical protein
MALRARWAYNQCRGSHLRSVTRSETTTPTHIGRGGTGNVFDPKFEEARVAQEANKAGKEEHHHQAAAAPPAGEKAKKGEEPGWAEKGKNLLGLGKKKE